MSVLCGSVSQKGEIPAGVANKKSVKVIIKLNCAQGEVCASTSRVL